MPLLALTFTLLGIALGTPADRLRAALGDPLLVENTSKVSRTASYLRSDDPSGVLRVTERDGVVSAVEFERERSEPVPSLADSHGVFLGMSRAAVTTARGKPAFETVNTVLYPEDPNEDASFIYRFDGDIVVSIKLVGSGTSAAANSALVQLSEAAGDSYAAAILDVTPTVLGSDHFRERYLAVHDCESAGRTSSVERRAGKSYAVVSASCGSKRRTLYFDISRARP